MGTGHVAVYETRRRIIINRRTSTFSRQHGLAKALHENEDFAYQRRTSVIKTTVTQLPDRELFSSCYSHGFNMHA